MNSGFSCLSTGEICGSAVPSWGMFFVLLSKAAKDDTHRHGVMCGRGGISGCRFL
jgi:hypothetical protein